MTLKTYSTRVAIAVLFAATIPNAALAQSSGYNQSDSQEALGSAELRSAIRRLASDPADSDALIDAGNAALQLGDANAALNFFMRAETLQPSSGRIKLGLASASVRTENPFEALRYFDEAVRLGIPERTLAADRALAFDLLGNFDRAQSDYNLARSASTSTDLIVRQAISLGLAGRNNDADKMLLPLLQQNNADAWRARSFILAARGDYNESVKVARGFLDPRSAQKMEIYLRQMPKLTGAQQAAAIHLGHFPVGDVGRDSAAIQNVASNYPAGKASGSGRLIPSGDPLGPKGNARTASDAPKLSRKDRALAAKQASMNVQVPDTLARPVAGLSSTNAPPTQAATQSMVQGPAMPIDIARGRLLSAEKASFNLVAAALPAPAPVFAPAAAPPVQAQLPSVPAQPAAAPIQAPSLPVPAQPAAPVQVAAIQPAPTAPAPIAPPPAAPVIAAPPAQQQDSVPAIANLAQKAVVAEAAPAPAPAPAPAVVPAPAPAIVAAAAAPAVAAPVLPASVPDVAPTPAPTAAPVFGPAESLADAAPPVATEPSKPEGSSFNLGDVVSAIKIPDSEKKRDVVPVDLKKLAAAQPKPAVKETAKPDKPAKKAEPAKPEYPARYWVQIATGDASAFRADMRNFGRKYPDLFKGQSAWTSPWSKSSRLVVGPFDNLTAAKKWEAEFRKGGGDGFVWQSGDGTQVDPLK